jgi:CheY-like chemotaxis protein
MGIKPTILVAEDDPGDAFLLERVFGQAAAPLSLHFVRDGQEAINYLAGEGRYADRRKYPVPVLLVLDLKLPRLNGLEVIAWVRSQAALKLLPIAVVTGSDEPADMNRARELGANCCLEKPLTVETLPDFITSHSYWTGIDRASGGGQAGS